MTQVAIRTETADISAKLRRLTREERKWLDGVIVGLTAARANEREYLTAHSGEEQDSA